jgi:hypothetical protein
VSARRVAWGAVGLGALGVALTFVVHGATRFWANWLVWYLFLLTTALGALFLVALEHLVDARWSVPIRRVPERLASLLLPLTPVALVALLSLPTLFHKWTGPEAAHHAIVAGKAAWLNVPFFSLRVVICLVLWLVSYRILVGGSLRQDASKDPRVNVRLRRFAPAFMAIFAFTVTVVAFDWISSLEPEWYSDIFGVYVFAGTFLAGLAATTLAVLWLKSRGRLAAVRGDHLFNLGGLLFAFTVFWSYIGFAQYMLMWYADLPEEIFWYQQRIDGPWRIVALLLALVHFFIPFFALITRDAKSDPRRLARVGALVLFAHLLDLYWLVVPSVTGRVWLSWPELSFALLFLGGAFLWLRRAMAIGEDMPVGDAFLAEALEYRR